MQQLQKKDKIVSVVFSEQLHKEAKELANKKGIKSLSAYIRQLLLAELRNNKEAH